MTSADQEQHQDRTMTTVSKKSIIAKMFKVRKRREMLLAQVCLVCSVLLVAWGMSSILTRTGESEQNRFLGVSQSPQMWTGRGGNLTFQVTQTLQEMDSSCK